MYGYDQRDKKPPEQGSWRETMSFVWATFLVMAPIIGIFCAIIAGLMVTIMIATVSGWLALIPAVLATSGIVFWLRREKKNYERDEADLTG